MSSQPKCVSITKSNHKPKGEKSMSTNPNAVPEYRNLPITALVESPTNPRRRFNEERLQELAAYVPGHIICLLFRWSFCGPRHRKAHG